MDFTCCCDWSGRYGIVFAGKPTQWIIANPWSKGIQKSLAYDGICQISSDSIRLAPFLEDYEIYHINDIKTSPVWSEGTIMQINSPTIEIFNNIPESTIICSNLDCYVTENADYVVVDQKDVFKVNLTTGVKLSDKLIPNYKSPTALPGFGAEHLLNIKHWEMNALGLLQITTYNDKILYSELSIGETLKKESDFALTSSYSRSYIVEMGEAGPRLRIVGKYKNVEHIPKPNMLRTFYHTYRGDDEYILENFIITKFNGRIEIKSRGLKTKAAQRELID